MEVTAEKSSMVPTPLRGKYPWLAWMNLSELIGLVEIVTRSYQHTKAFRPGHGPRISPAAKLAGWYAC
jgi:hypothetical protein